MSTLTTSLPEHSTKLMNVGVAFRAGYEEVLRPTLETATSIHREAHLGAEVYVNSSDPALMQYGTDYANQRAARYQELRKTVAEKCRALPEAENIRKLRDRLQSINRSIGETQSKLVDLESKYRAALLRGDPVEDLEQQQEQAEKEVGRKKALLRLVGGGNPGQGNYDSACPPVLKVAIEAYRAKAAELFEQAKRDFIAEVSQRERERLDEASRALPVLLLEISVERQQIAYPQHIFPINAIPEV